MTLSLDTNAFLWWLDDPQLLSKAARKAIGDGKNTVYVSAAVVWEIAIKANRFLPLPVTIPHALAVETLPHHHSDPFDRLLIAQARHEGFKFVSRDSHVARYGVPHIVA